MATLASAAVTQAGTLETLVAAAAGGDKVAPAPNQFLIVNNGGASSRTVTVNSQVPSNYGTDVDLAVTVTAGQRKIINLSDYPRFTSQSDGLIAWTYSSEADLTVGVFRL